MRKDKEMAFKMRRKGKSYQEISRILGVPTSTLSYWFKDLHWSKVIRDSLAEKASFSSPEKIGRMVSATRKKYAALHESYRVEALKEYSELRTDRLFVSGLMLYWGAGDKNVKNSLIDFVNSDPEMIRLFHLFLLKILRVEKERIRFKLLLYPDLIDSVQIQFWSRFIGVDKYQFTKSTFIKGRHTKRRLSNGVCHVRYGSRQIKEKMMAWIKLLHSDLLN